ncbi:hypothetical protein V2J09_023599, partial [Rumex salicifolius]
CPHFAPLNHCLSGYQPVPLLSSNEGCFNVPRRRFVTLANIWVGTFSGSRTYKSIYSSRHIDSRIYGIGGQNRRWTRRSINTKVESEESALCGKPSTRPGISEEFVAGTKININRVESKGVQQIQYSDIQLKIAEDKDLARLVTFIVMDLETSGLSRETGRIIEIALQDLKGGRNSTFQTLVNPQCSITNAIIHGIRDDMVKRPDVPRMKELIPILLQYIKSRQQPGGYVVLVSHNSRNFDAPFLINEFNRHSYEIPSNWLFLDTLPLAREVRKPAADGSKVSLSLQALREHYGIQLVGSAHRAMSDVHCLALIFQKLTFELKLPVSQLMERCFKASDVGNSAKKKKKTS